MRLFGEYGVVASLMLQRELRIIASKWKTIAGSALVYASMIGLSAGYFMPQMGMPITQSLPLFIGSFVITCLSIGYSFAIEAAYDLRSPKVAFYYYALPVSFGTMLASLVSVLMLRMLIVVLPVFFLGFTIVGQWHLFSISWFGAVAMVLLGVQFFALLLLTLAHSCSLESLLGNIWPRFFSPLIAFGCAMYPLQVAIEKAWWLSRIMLLNPLTYCSDGLRSALLGGSHYVSFSFCIAMLLVYNGLLWCALRYVVIRAINPVRA